MTDEHEVLPWYRQRGKNTAMSRAKTTDRVRFTKPGPDVIYGYTNVREVLVDGTIVGHLVGEAENPRNPDRPTRYHFIRPGTGGHIHEGDTHSRLEDARLSIARQFPETPEETL